MSSKVHPGPTPRSNEVVIGPLALASTTGVFILIGVTSSLFGPLLLTLAQHFHLSIASAGSILSIYFVGALLGILPAWWAMTKVSGRALLRSGTLTIAVGALGASMVSSWSLFLASVFVIGLGFGSLDIGLNSMLARTALEGRAHRLSVANAGFGIGAVLCPLSIIAVGQSHFATVFVGIVVVSLLLVVSMRGIVAPPAPVRAADDNVGGAHPQRRPMLLTFAAGLILYVAVESTTAGWIAAQLHGDGYSKLTGSLVTAGFWTGLALGRFLGGPLHHRFSHKALVLVGLSLAVLLSLSALSKTLAPFAYPLLGLVIASVFAMGLLWYTILVPNDSNGMSLMFLLMMLGGAAGPGLMSVIVSTFGSRVVPFVLSTYALLGLAVFTSALRFSPLSNGAS